MRKNEYAIQKSITAEEIRILREKLTLSQQQFAKLANVSRNTVEKWESKKKPIKGTIVSLIKLLQMNPTVVENLSVPVKRYPLRLLYMYKSQLCTVLDIDERNKKIEVYNYVNDDIYKAFGKNENPSFQEYEEFLKSRCFPETRNHIKLVLNDLNIPFYDPFLIIEKTLGKMEDDNFWIKIER